MFKKFREVQFIIFVQQELVSLLLDYDLEFSMSKTSIRHS